MDRSKGTSGERLRVITVLAVIEPQTGAQRLNRQRVQGLPAIVEGGELFRLEPACRVADRAPSLVQGLESQGRRLSIDVLIHALDMTQGLEHFKNN